MKRYISAILIPCFLLQFFGCYSLQPLEASDQIFGNHTNPERSIKFILKNGDEITTQIENCGKVTNKKFVVFGTGTCINKRTHKDRTFRGLLDESVIDSIKTGTVNSENYLVCWLKDSTRISFKQNDYSTFELSSDSSYWVVKDLKSSYLFNDNDVKEVQVDKINIVPTAIIGIGLIVFYIVLFENAPFR